MASPYKMKFSPSKAEIWMNCPGAPRLIAEIPEQPSSKYAAEGTAAHQLAESCLRQGDNADQWLGENIETKDGVFKVTQNMVDAVQVYLDRIREDLENNGLTKESLEIEKSFQLEKLVCVKGTNDASFSSPMDMLYVYDYKHGEGTYVEVENNPQLLIYAIGAMQRAGWVNEGIRITIAQPRFRDENVPQVRSWDITKRDLQIFMDHVQEAINDAMDPSAPCVPGKWCKNAFCPAYGVCPAVRKKAVSVVDESSTALVFPDPAKLSPDQMAKVLEASELISGWAGAVKAEANRQAKELGIKIPGFKLVSKKGRRAWVDETLVENEFEHEFGDAIYEKKLKSPAQMEKVVGKDKVKELVEVPDNGTELVPESAKGEEVSVDAAFSVLE